MENYKLVLPEHLNHYGYLFGGNLLKWVDENAWIAATLDFPGCNFVTISMDEVEFRKSIREGSILRFEIQQVKRGNTSIQYQVEVYLETSKTKQKSVFSTQVTLVHIDKTGGKKTLPM